MKQVNVKKLILPNIPYVFIALLATKVSEAVRLAPGSDASTKLLNIMTGLNTAFHSLVPSFHPIDLCVGVAAAIAIRLAVYIKGKNAKKFRKNLEYGSARWGTAEDIKPYVDPAFENNIILTQTERLTMNSRPKDPKTARNKNVLIVGGSGSGKTRFWLKPNLLQCTSKTYPTSFVVTDPKGDIVVSCGHALQKNGYQIKILNSLNFKKSMHYNPFAYIHSEKDILKLVTTLIANTKGEGKAGDDFWVKAETLLYTALIGYIHYEAPVEEQNFSTLIEFINAMEVREDDEDFKNPVDLMFEELKKRKPDHFAVRQYAKFKLSAGKTAKSILISCGARLAPFDIQELRELTAYDELQLDTLGDRKTALFIIMSDTDDTFNFLISMCYTQLFNLLCEKADDVYGGRLPVHVRCLIDEAANIGQIPRLEKLVATIRSREISCCLVLQAQSQLKALYKDSADTIIGNMDCSIFLGGKEPGTLKELAAALGKETIDSYNTGESRGREVSHSLNYQKLGKDVKQVDEVSPLYGKTEEYYRKILDLAREENIPVLVTIAPYFLIDEKSEKMFNRVGEIAGEYGDLFLDGNKLVDEIGVDYQVDNADDVGHLNYLGNQKYTKYLGTYIKEHYTVSDRRADAAYESWQKNADYIREMIVNQELKESGDMETISEKLQNPNYWVFISVDDSCDGEDQELQRFLGAAGLGDALQNGFPAGVWLTSQGKILNATGAGTAKIYIRKKPKEFCIQRMAGADGQMENQIICDRVSYRKVDSGVNVVVYDLMTEEIEDQFGIDVSDGCRIVR